MNQFVKLRKTFFKNNSAYDFTPVLIKNVMGIKNQLQTIEEKFVSRFNNINEINKGNELDESKLKELLSYLGEDPYTDRFTIDTILKEYSAYPKEKIESLIGKELKNTDNNKDKIYHLLDLNLEINSDILSLDSTVGMIEKYKDDFDIITLLFESLKQFNLKASKEYLYNQIKIDYPTTIKIQILALLDHFYSIDNLDLTLIRDEIRVKGSLVFVNDYIDFLKGKHQREKNGVVILQSMFYGDFEDSGKGNNGGLAILLKILGNEVSFDERIDRVITITISDVSDKLFMVNYQDNHLFVRLPAYLNRTVSDPFLKRELFTKRYIKNYLEKLDTQPDLFHIRYLDNASVAVAKLSKELNKKLVLTLAPDPHRNMVDEEGVLKKFYFDELQILANKIAIGDNLIFESDKVLGIGSGKVNKELHLYFPQFTHYNIKDKVKMIAEGIKTDEDMFKDKEDVDVCNLSELIGIHPSFCDKPIILNVGRLAKIKGQVNLFKAWSNSKLNENYNLLIIGGDLENPNKDEQEIIDFFNQAIKDRPELKDKFYHKGALHNDKIKLVEKSIKKKTFDFPHIYLASSIKEEFGIAILEAMSRGFLIIAPIKGGVKSYIRNRENGFLIDTSSSKTIARATEKILYNSDISTKEFREIQKAGKGTIEKEFSIDKIAKNFTDTYLSVLGDKENEV